jgi:hypothetical protein
MMGNNPSDRIILQRLRNRVIEELETAASYEEQRRYQKAVPSVNVPAEMICGWFNDHVWEGWQKAYTPPVFTPEEIDAIAGFDKVFRAVKAKLPSHTPSLSELVGAESWDRLRLAAQEALTVFQQRGKLSEDEEIT